MGASMADDEAQDPAHGEPLSSLQGEWLKLLAAYGLLA
jgi:hypothetical protein